MIKYNNGIRLLSDKPDGGSLERDKKQVIYLHEPVEELIFTQVLLNDNVKTFLNLGVHVGYYVILAKKLSPKTRVIGFEGQKNFSDTIDNNLILNGIPPKSVEIHYKFLTTDRFYKKRNNDIIHLSEFLSSVKSVDFMVSDVQGAETGILFDLITSQQIHKINQILIGTHDKFKGKILNSHKPCLDMLKMTGYDIVYQCQPRKVWLQPDGIIWAKKRNTAS